MLKIYESGLTPAAIPQLAQLKALREIEVSEMQWGQADYDALRRAMPQTRVSDGLSEPVTAASGADTETAGE